MTPLLSRLIQTKYPHSKLVLNKSVRSFHSSLYNFGAIKPFLLADIGEGITECEIVQWFVKPGQTVAEFDKICEVQSDKASVEISSRYAGNITKVHYDVNQVAKVGSALVDIETEENDNEEVVDTATDANPTTVQDTAPAAGSSSYIAQWETPAVRRLLHEYGLNVKDLSGSGKNGRVLKGDILSLIKSGSLEKKVYEMKKHVIKTVEAADVEGSIPLNAIQKAMFKTMTKSLAIPQLGFKDEIDLNSTSEYKNALNTYIADNPDLYQFKKISYLPIFIKCLSLSLSFFPIMNAQITENAGVPQINYRDVHNVGVAMDTPQGLIVPNIKNVQQKTIFEIASEIHRLTHLAKKGAIPLSDLKGGTITLSNIGSIGGTYANPIIVSNESAIVALGSARKLPRFSEGSNTMVAKQIMPVSWSADHRVIDGATMAQFSNTWKSFIENPALLASKLH
ncbi:2-oxoacid dehydrogenases acyltransferase-domain-containing protein [Thamnidium elegans]|uniref:Dihydrolipoamide acetyltransferase component of pyruvate dehydrogenase complex n=1 Tax=Thamnidium elegans TaxID=101142 RepID=A0A8H7SR05_9FUNG|nr:hypothetical protein INT48_003387 [Thamnidium elegans]KAI8071894.1 2-oxoacid dehydrogenases acyltransferase-domain-containing protein [Thamnidium elegans]